jgi:hypothetical protein
MSDPLNAIRENRDILETLAESDLRTAKYARWLLDAADEGEAGRGHR